MNDVRCWHVYSGPNQTEPSYCTSGEHAPKPPIADRREAMIADAQREVADFGRDPEAELSVEVQNLFAEPVVGAILRKAFGEPPPMILGRRIVLEERVPCPPGWREVGRQ